MNLSDERRRYLYKVFVAALPILILSKVITPEWVQPITDAISAVLGISGFSLAAANVPKSND